ncbi:hypothetical protein PG991_010730 [Apiospora marii]|uniref:FAS1 domain-containing protein n=1 Tax=Apiospora marii TaxID=335849 RepID=A0ABR1RD37_9PEZI
MHLLQKFPELLLQLPNLNGITIVAPTNEAFERIPLTSLNAIWKADDASVAVPILQYHIVMGQFPADAMTPGAPVFAPTLLTDPRWTNLSAGGQLVRADKQPDGFVALTSGSGSRSSLVPFSKDGRRDLRFAGGIVQAVDNLLVPPTALNETLTAYSDLSFLGALYAAGLYDEFATCGASGNCTIFAPSVRAFRAVNSTLASLSRDDLIKVLRYHMVPGQVLTSNLLSNGTTLPSALASGSAQKQLQVRRAGNYLYLNSAHVVQQDLLFANGVVHLLDNVLNPFLPDPAGDAPQPTPNPELGTQVPVFSTGSAEAALATVTDADAMNSLPLPFTTALPCTVSCPEPTVTDPAAAAGSGRGTSSTHSARATSSSKGLAAAARCTGFAQPGSAAVAAALAWGVGGYWAGV